MKATTLKSNAWKDTCTEKLRQHPYCFWPQRTQKKTITSPLLSKAVCTLCYLFSWLPASARFHIVLEIDTTATIAVLDQQPILKHNPWHAIMKFLFDYFPIICFFVVYKWYGVFAATAATMIACVLQNLLYWLKNKKLEKLHVITLVSVLILGTFTLLFHKAIFIQWKPSIIYWVFALVLLFSQTISKKNLLARMLGDKIALPEKIWAHINVAWIIFFTALGFLNLYVVYHYSMNAWVNFKLFGTLGLTIVFTIAQAIYMSKHVIHQK